MERRAPDAGSAVKPRVTPDAARRPRGTLAVEVTRACGRHCVYCAAPWSGEAVDLDGPPALPTAELVALVDATLAASGRHHVQLTGGEPLLRADLVALITALGRPDRRVSLITDGGLLTPALAADLARLRVGPVQPTLLAARRDVHDALKGAVAFDATVRAIGYLRAARVPVSVAFVCTRRNAQHFQEVVELCYALGVDTVAFSRFCAAGRGGGTAAEALLPTPDQVAQCLGVAEFATARLGMRVQVAISLPLCVADLRAYPHLSFGRCALGTAAPGFTLDPAGRLRACSVSPTVLGDLCREPFASIVARAETRYFAAMRAQPAACAGCPAWASCGGGCRETARGCYGDTARPDPLARPAAVPHP